MKVDKKFMEQLSGSLSKEKLEGKSKKHARKCLARQVSNLIWKTLFAV